MVLPVETVAQIKSMIDTAEQVLVTCHMRPDGDAIGSLTAVGQALAQMGKQFTLACDDSAPGKYDYLPLIDEVVTTLDQQIAYDMLIALDCGDLDRMGKVYGKLPKPRPPIINIDHHVSNTRFGTVNLVVSDSTATAEILADLLPELGVTLTPEISMSLLTGLVTDTLCFRTSAVNSHTLKVAGRLMEAGADLSAITMQALILRPYADVEMWRIGLNKMRLEEFVSWTTISLEDRHGLVDGSGSADGLGNFIADVNEAAMSAVLTEKEHGRVVVGFRSRPPYNVSDLAVSFGGGGHRYASGCTVMGTLDDVEEKVVSRAKEMIAAQRRELGLTS